MIVTADGVVKVRFKLEELINTLFKVIESSNEPLLLLNDTDLIRLSYISERIKAEQDKRLISKKAPNHSSPDQ